MMRFSFLAAATLLAGSVCAEEIGSVDTAWNMIGSNHRIVVDAYDDPGIPGVACHVSRAVAGGVFSTSDPNEASIACRQVGPIDWDAVRRLPKTDPAIFKERTALLFKELKVGRMIDEKRRTLVYLVYTTKFIDGSPKNVVSTVPVMPWR